MGTGHEQKGTVRRTSLAVVRSPSQFIRGKTLRTNSGWKSRSCCSSSASRKWSGKEDDEALQLLMAQVKKFTVIIFIMAVVGGALCRPGSWTWLNWVYLQNENKDRVPSNLPRQKKLIGRPPYEDNKQNSTLVTSLASAFLLRQIHLWPSPTKIIAR